MGSQDLWTNEEINILKEEYPTTKTELLAEKLGKTASQITWKASYLGIKKLALKPNKLRNWTKEEIDYLQVNFDADNPKESIKNISKYLNRTIKAINQKLSLLKINLRPWTNEDIQYLINNFVDDRKRGSRARLAEKLKKSIPQINQKIYTLGLIKTTKRNCRLCDNEFYIGRNREKIFCSNKCSYDFYILKRQIIFQDFLAKFKIKLGCCICNYNKDWKAIDFHHINPKEKEYSISLLFGHIESKKGREKLSKELTKCLSLCRNCHVELHTLLEQNIDEYNNLIVKFENNLGTIFDELWKQFEELYKDEYLTKQIKDIWYKRGQNVTRKCT